MVEQRMQVLAGALAAVMQIQHRAIHAFADQELLERRLVLQIALGLAALDLVGSEEHTSELQSLMRISYAVFCLKKKNRSEYHSCKQRYLMRSAYTSC